MTYTFDEWSRLMKVAGMYSRNGTFSRYAYAKYLASGVVFSIWLFWFRRNGD